MRIWTAVVAWAMFLMPTAVFAAPLPGTDPPIENETISGEIVDVNVGCRTISIRNHSGIQHFAIGGDTRVDLEGARLEDLKQIHPGQLATVFFRRSHAPAWLVLTQLH